MKKSILAALLVSVALCGTAAAKDEIVISTGVNMVAGKFDPTTGHGVWGPDIFHCHLVKVGADNKLELDLAVSEKVGEGGTTYTYEIRKDAKFADGVPLTAKDVVFTFETAKSKASAADLSAMESVKALDDYTVEFKLSKPWSLFPYVVSFVGIVPAHAYKEGYGDRPLGSGAWKIVDFQKGQQLILAPNEHYYGPKSPFKRVTILKVDEDAALAAAQSGQLDFVYVESEYAHTPVKGMKLLALDVLGALAVNLPVIPETTLADGTKVGNNVTCDPAVRKALNIGIALLCSDIIITVSACFAFGMETGLFSILGLIIKSLFMDLVTDNLKTKKCFQIITSDPEPIEQFITAELHRGATRLHGEGSYTHEGKTVLLTVVSRHEAVLLRNYIHKQDPAAFMIITSSTEIIGKGFRGVN